MELQKEALEQSCPLLAQCCTTQPFTGLDVNEGGNAVFGLDDLLGPSEAREELHSIESFKENQQQKSFKSERPSLFTDSTNCGKMEEEENHCSFLIQRSWHQVL